MKKIILFDNDGVLVETEMWYYEANKTILKQELNLTLEFDTYMEIMARGGTAWEIAQHHGIKQSVINQCRFKRDALYQTFLNTKDIAIPNVKNTLAKLSKKFKMAIITTSRRVDFDLIHKNRGIIDYMDFSLCVEEYKRAKPYPDPYLEGLKRFNAKKEETIIVEDSQRGLRSAVAAEIDCVIVHNEFTKTHDFTQAKHFINSLDQLCDLLEVS